MSVRLFQSVALFLAISSSAWGVKFSSDVPRDIQKQMIEDLNFVNQVQGVKQTPLHQQIFGPVAGTSYKNFFETRVEEVGTSGCGSSIAVACVYPWNGPRMYITNNYIKFSHPQVARLMVVFHEARHTESQNGNWGHDYCPNPFRDEQGRDITSIWTGAALAGEDACDSTPLGSYGSSTIMLKNIAKFCSNCSDKVKMDAELYSTNQLQRIIGNSARSEMLRDFSEN